MKNMTVSPDNELTIRVPRELRQHAQQIAMQQGETLSDLVCRAVSSYLTAYSAKHQQVSQPMGPDEARQLMQRLGQGLGEGMSPHNAARHHDEYLCKKQVRHAENIC